MKRIAMILNGVVIDIAVWDGTTAWDPGVQYTLVDITGQYVNIGWLYNGSIFQAPSNPGF